MPALPVVNIDWRVLLVDTTGAALAVSAGAAVPVTDAELATVRRVAEDSFLKLSRLEEILDGALQAPLRVAGTDGVSPRPLKLNLDGTPAVGGFSKALSATFTRPADTTAYAIGDAMANSTSAPVPLAFVGVTRLAAGSTYLVGATLLDEANQTTKLQAYLHLFSSIPTGTNDNAALAVATADLVNYVGLIDFTGTAVVTNSASGASGNVVIPGVLKTPIPFNLTANTTLYGILQANNAYTHVSGEVFVIVLNLSQD